MAGVKEASTDIVKTLRIRNECGEDFHIWSGNDEMAAAAIAIGAKGVISVVSNVAPEMTQAMAKAALDGDMDTAAALQRKLLPLIDALFCEVNPMPVKAAMAIQGYDCGPCRLPLCDVKEETKEKLRELGLLDDHTKVYLSHIGHLLHQTHEELAAEAAELGMTPAFDGLTVEI